MICQTKRKIILYRLKILLFKLIVNLLTYPIILMHSYAINLYNLLFIDVLFQYYRFRNLHHFIIYIIYDINLYLSKLVICLLEMKYQG